MAWVAQVSAELKKSLLAPRRATPVILVRLCSCVGLSCFRIPSYATIVAHKPELLNMRFLTYVLIYKATNRPNLLWLFELPIQHGTNPAHAFVGSHDLRSRIKSRYGDGSRMRGGFIGALNHLVWPLRCLELGEYCALSVLLWSRQEPKYNLGIKQSNAVLSIMKDIYCWVSVLFLVIGAFVGQSRAQTTPPSITCQPNSGITDVPHCDFIYEKLVQCNTSLPLPQRQACYCTQEVFDALFEWACLNLKFVKVNIARWMLMVVM